MLNTDMKRIHNLYKLVVREERVLNKQGIIYRMNSDEGVFELRTKEAVYCIHPKTIAIKYLIGDKGEDQIYKPSLFTGLLTGIEKAFKRYKYRGRLNEANDRVKTLILQGFDLRKIY